MWGSRSARTVVRDLLLQRLKCSANSTGRCNYEDALRKHLLPSMGSRPIDSYIYNELAAIVANLDCTHPKTRNNILAPLRGVFVLALRDGIITDNPARHIRNRRQQKEPSDPFSRDEMERIVSGFTTSTPT